MTKQKGLTSAQNDFGTSRPQKAWRASIWGGMLLAGACASGVASAAALTQTSVEAAKPAAAPTSASASKPKAAPRNYANHARAQAWAREVAARQGWALEWVQSHLQAAHFSAASQRLARPAPPSPNRDAPRSTVADWRSYRANLITPERVAAGLRFWAANEAALARAEDVFGVPAATIVGILGVETHFGRNQGRTRVLDALATLAFDFPASHPRAAQRSAYFAGELEAFLMAIAQESDPARARELAEQRGSWAGAMGMGQFMPTSQARWALDFDEDARVDLRGATGRADDAIGSVAHYLHGHGWQAGLPVWQAAHFDASAQWSPLLAPDIVPSFTTAQLAALGARAAQPNSAIAADAPLAVIALHQGEAATGYFLGTRNFYVLTRYNQSSYYAAAVHDLGQEIAAARAGTAPEVIALTFR